MVGLNPRFREEYIKHGGDLQWLSKNWNMLKSLATVACGEYAYEEDVIRKKIMHDNKSEWSLMIALSTLRQFRLRSLPITSNKRFVPSPCNKEMLRAGKPKIQEKQEEEHQSTLIKTVPILSAEINDHIWYHGETFMVVDILNIKGYTILKVLKRFNSLLTDEVSFIFTDGDNYHFSYNAKEESLEALLDDIRGKYIKKEIT